MELCLRTGLLLFLVSGTLTQDGLDLSDLLDQDPTPKPTDKPPKSGGGGTGGDGFKIDLADALGPDANSKPEPAGRGGGGSFFDLDLFDISGDYKPGGGTAGDPTAKPADKPPKSGGDGFDLSDPLDPGKPLETLSDMNMTRDAVTPTDGPNGRDGFDLSDPLDPDTDTEPADKPPKSGGGGGGGGDLNPKPKPAGRGGDGTFPDLDLFDISNGDYKPGGGTAGAVKPTDGPNGGDGFDLSDPLDPDTDTEPADKPPKSGGGGGGGDGFKIDWADALDPDLNAKPKPAGRGGDGTFPDLDLFDISNGDYKPGGGTAGAVTPTDGPNGRGI